MYLLYILGAFTFILTTYYIVHIHTRPVNSIGTYQTYFESIVLKRVVLQLMGFFSALIRKLSSTPTECKICRVFRNHLYSRPTYLYYIIPISYIFIVETKTTIDNASYSQTLTQNENHQDDLTYLYIIQIVCIKRLETIQLFYVYYTMAAKNMYNTSPV